MLPLNWPAREIKGNGVTVNACYPNEPKKRTSQRLASAGRDSFFPSSKTILMDGGIRKRESDITAHHVSLYQAKP